MQYPKHVHAIGPAEPSEMTAPQMTVATRSLLAILHLGGRRGPLLPQGPQSPQNLNISEATKASLILFQVACQVIFYTDELALSPPVITDGERWHTLTAGADLTEHMLTEIATPNTATPEAIGNG